MQLLHQTLPLLVVVIGCAVFLQPTAAAVDAQGGEKVLKLLTKSVSCYTLKHDETQLV